MENAAAPISVALANDTSVNRAQPLNAPSPILVNLSDDTDTNGVWAKAYSPTLSTLLRFILINCEPLNALSPIALTPLGTLKVIIRVSRNALSPIYVSADLSVNVTLAIPLAPNADAPILVTVSGIFMLDKPVHFINMPSLTAFSLPKLTDEILVLYANAPAPTYSSELFSNDTVFNGKDTIPPALSSYPAKAKSPIYLTFSPIVKLSISADSLTQPWNAPSPI